MSKRHLHLINKKRARRPAELHSPALHSDFFCALVLCLSSNTDIWHALRKTNENNGKILRQSENQGNMGEHSIRIFYAIVSFRAPFLFSLAMHPRRVCVMCFLFIYGCFQLTSESGSTLVRIEHRSNIGTNDDEQLVAYRKCEYAPQLLAATFAHLWWRRAFRVVCTVIFSSHLLLATIVATKRFIRLHLNQQTVSEVHMWTV